MSRPAQIAFLSTVAPLYDPVVRLMGFAPLWRATAEVAAPAAGEPALDVCTGSGGVAIELARRGARVTGLDRSGGMLQQADRKRNGAAVHLVQMDARDLAFRDRSFPLVTCSMALHEMAEAERTQVLGEIGRVAADRVVVAEHRVPAHWAAALLFRLRRLHEYLESDDFERFVRHDVPSRLDRAGLAVERQHDVGAYRIWRCRVRRT